MIAQGEFPVRPGYQQGESLAGYLYRLHSANGHTLSTRTAYLITQLYDTDATNQDHCASDEIRQLVGHDHLLDVASWIDGLRHVQALTPRWQRQRLKRDRFLICPECLRARAVHLGLWELPQVTACPIHRCELAAKCERCSRRFGWSLLNPDWHCRCGQSLLAMHVKPAAGPLCALAEHICYAHDVQRPIDYPVRGAGEAYAVPLSLEMNYRLLQRLHGLRRIVVDAIGSGRRPEAMCSWYESRARQCPHRWECALLTRWPEGLHLALMRLARRACQGDASTFVAVQQCLPIRYGINHLVGADVEGRIIEPLRQAIDDLISQHKAPFQTYALVLFNPCVPIEQRTIRMHRLGIWWRALRQTVLCNDRAEGSDVPTWLGHPTSEEKKEALVVRFMNRMVEFAEASVEPQCCRRIFQEWHGAQLVSANDDPAALIAAFSATLMQLPQALLANMVRLADRIDGGDTL